MQVEYVSIARYKKVSTKKVENILHKDLAKKKI